MADQEVIVSFDHISMRFPEVLANDDVSFDIRRGEIFALVGENGAGKSTLMNILYGMNTPTSGDVWVKGERMTGYTPAKAIAHGIGMVHQHFMLIPSFTVSQNIVLNHEPRTGLGNIFYDFKEADAVVDRLTKEYGLEVDPHARVEDLSVGLQQRVEILKTLHRGADILILDEPTAVLTPQETDELFDVIRRIVREKNMTVIIITHKLYEVTAISDRVGVMRSGKLVAVCNTADVDERELASMMVGKDVLMEALPHKPAGDHSIAIEVENLYVRDNRGLPAVKGVSLSVARGEILGIAGVEGNGQSELIEALTGMRNITSGSITINGKPAAGMTPGAIRQLGLSHVPEDRLATGISAEADVTENMAIGKHRKRPISIGGWLLRPRNMRQYAQDLYTRFDIRGGGIGTKAGSLSGGNMQKVVVAREFSFDTNVLIISQPTRGVDIGAMYFIHRQIMDKRNDGCAILLVSADLDELYRLSDRLVTIFEGEITGTFDPQVTPKNELSHYMTGGRKEAES